MAKEGIITIKCEACGAPLEVEEGKPVGFCSFCGAKYDVSAITKGDKEIELAKINNQAYIESEAAKQKYELEKLKQEKEWKEKQQSLEEDKEKKEAFKKGKFKGALIIFTIIFGLGALLSITMSKPLSAVIAFVQIGLIIFAWLTASRAIKINFPAAHIIAFIVSIVLILPYINIFSKDFGKPSKTEYEKFEWNNIVLCDILPEPSSDMGTIYSNTENDLRIHIANISDDQYNDYKNLCKEKGFNIDGDESSSYFTAYNEEGYKIQLSYYDSSNEMSLYVEPPMEMKTIEWPNSAVGKMLPVPKSNKGKFSYEYEDHFFVEIGDTTIDDFSDYVKACSDKGFIVDYNKGDDFYYADNSEGYHLSLNYRGNNIMAVEISAPEETVTTTEEITEAVTSENAVEATSATTAEETTTTTETITTAAAESGSIRPDFKEAMDSYEVFIDEYIVFMKKYQNASATDMIGMLSDYTNYLEKYGEMAEKMEKWKDDLNDEEMKYYLEVMTRVNKKLTDAAIA